MDPGEKLRDVIALIVAVALFTIILTASWWM